MLAYDPKNTLAHTMPAGRIKAGTNLKDLPFWRDVWDELWEEVNQEDLRIERHVWDSQEQFLAAYQRHMSTIYKELERHKRLAQEQEFNMRQNALVQKLTKDMNFFKETSFKLSTDSEAFRKDIQRLDHQLKECQNEKAVLLSATRRSQNIHKQLKAALNQSDEQVKRLSDSYKKLLKQQKQETFYRNIEDVENTFITTADLSTLGEVQRLIVQSFTEKDGIDVAQRVFDIFESKDQTKQQSVRRVLDEAVKLISTKLQIKFDALAKENQILHTRVKKIKDIQPYQREMDAMFIKCVRAVKSEVSRRKAAQSSISHQTGQTCSKLQRSRSPAKSHLRNTGADVSVEDRPTVELMQKVLNKDFTFNQKIKDPKEKLNQSSEIELKDIPEIMDDLDNKDVLQHQDKIKVLDLFIKDSRVSDVLMEIYFHPDKNLLKKESTKGETVSTSPAQLNSAASNVDDTTVPYYKSEMNITMEEVVSGSGADLASLSGGHDIVSDNVETLNAESCQGSKASANLIHSIRPTSYKTNWVHKKRKIFGHNTTLLSKRRNTETTTTAHDEMERANITIINRGNNVTIISPRPGNFEMASDRVDAGTDSLDKRFQNFTTFMKAIDTYKRPQTTDPTKREQYAQVAHIKPIKRPTQNNCHKLNMSGKTKLPAQSNSNFFLA